MEPTHQIIGGRIEVLPEYISLRDQFAGLAMQGIVSSISSEDDYQRIKSLGRSVGLHASQWIARDAYKQADAMLAERERGR